MSKGFQNGSFRKSEYSESAAPSEYGPICIVESDIGDTRRPNCRISRRGTRSAASGGYVAFLSTHMPFSSYTWHMRPKASQGLIFFQVVKNCHIVVHPHQCKLGQCCWISFNDSSLFQPGHGPTHAYDIEAGM